MAKKGAKVETSILDELEADPPSERDDAATLEFLRAIDEHKRKTGRNFPSWSEVLDIILGLGYRKVR